MITFFRRLRQQLLTQNKFSRYLLYAIGEVVLVVIGILIALQINNWNEQQKLQEQEKKLLVSLHKELEQNITLLERKVTSNDAIMANMDKFLELAGKEGVKEYNIRTYIGIFNYNPAILESPILDDILESDSRTLISQSDLLPHLRRLQSNYKGIEKGEFYLDEFWNDKVTDYILKAGTGYVIFIDIPGDETDNRNQSEKLLKIDDQFLSLIAIKKGLQKEWLSSQKNSLEKSKKVLQLLNDNPPDY